MSKRSIIVEDSKQVVTKTENVPAADDKVQAQEPAPSDTAPVVPELPEKYRGKSVQDIIEMHQNAEKLAGRIANELGQYKQHASAWLDQKLTQSQKKVEPEEEIDDDLFIENPRQAVEKTVEKRVKKVEDKLDEFDRQQYELNFVSKYNVDKYNSDPEFADWLTKSSRRMEMAAVVRDYNTNWKKSVDTASELFDLYEEFKQAKTSAPVQKAAPKPEVKIPHAESAANSGNAGQSYEYTRSQLLDMRMSNRDKFDREQTKIIKAIREGRVLDDINH